MFTINFYTRDQCLLCDEALQHLKTLQHLYDFKIDVRDIETDEQWFEEFHLVIPVIELKGQQLYGNEISLLNIEKFINENK